MKASSDPGGIAALLDGRRTCICAGPGGVGKTTTSAAIAMGMAARGLRVAVVTIDPARRLADSLGLDDLGDEPQRVSDDRFAEHGLDLGGGELWAMMLDVKRTFDGIIEQLAPDAATLDEVLGNRIYQELSGAVAGSQEFTAMAKLDEISRSGAFDLVVLDTPPSRNALDFLDAPDRLLGFFTGRAVKLFLRPAGLGGRVFGAGAGVVLSVMKRVTGIDLLQDLSVFFRSLGGLIDGFVARAERVSALLEDPSTAYLIVCAPVPEAVDEAVFFHRKLREAGLETTGVIANRVHGGVGEVPDAAALAGALGAALAGRVVGAVTDAEVLAARDAASLARLEGEDGLTVVARVPQLAGDVHDVDGLLAVHAHLFAAQDSGTGTASAA